MTEKPIDTENLRRVIDKWGPPLSPMLIFTLLDALEEARETKERYALYNNEFVAMRESLIERAERAEAKLEAVVLGACRDLTAAEAKLAAVRARADRIDALFSGGPDTSCRTTWPNGVECVEVPMADVREAFRD